MPLRNATGMNTEHSTSMMEMMGVVTSAIAACAASRARQALFDFALDVFDDHDGIVDHDAGGQYQAEQAQGVDREAEQQQGGHGADDGDGDRNEGDDAGPPGLQKHDHHQHDEQHRFEECMDDGFNGAADENGGS